MGHLVRECRKDHGKAAGGVHTRDQVRCFNCQEKGHVAVRCPHNALFCEEQDGGQSVQERRPCTDSSGFYQRGVVEGHMVEDILLDTGCSRTLVHQALVPREKVLEGQVVTIRCIHGDPVLCPLAEIEMEVGGIPIKVEAAVCSSLPTSVLLGSDVPELTVYLKGPRGGEALADVAQAQEQKQLEEGLVRQPRGLECGVRSSSQLVKDWEEEDRTLPGRWKPAGNEWNGAEGGGHGINVTVG